MNFKLNIMKIRTILLLAGMLCFLGSQAQDIRFTQMYADPLKLNPALVGPNYHYNVNLAYRSQWSSVGSGYNTGQLTFMMPILLQDNGHKLDFGVTFLSDEQGAFNTVDAGLALGYTLRLSSSGHHLTAAIMGDYVQNSLDATNLTFDEQYQQGSFDGSNPTGENLLADQVSYIDAGLGLMWFYSPDRDSAAGSINAFAGVSGYHINEPSNSFSEGTSTLPRRITTLAGIKIFTTGKLDFSPQVRYDEQEGASEFATGLYTGYDVSEEFRGVLGVWYRDQNAFAFILEIYWKYFKLGYSYDLPGSEISSGVNNASVNEITLGFKLNRAEKKGIKHNVMNF
jgi:type IX secretion system PorP/SprF family membrane protein